jgi:hypothetical protein
MDPPILAIQLAIRSMECVVPLVSFFRSFFRTAYAERLAGSLTPRLHPARAQGAVGFSIFTDFHIEMPRMERMILAVLAAPNGSDEHISLWAP